MAFWALSFLYLALAGCVVAFELKRGGKLQADPLGILILIVVLQCVIPGVLTFGLLPMSRPGEATGIYAFDRIYNFADSGSAYLVWALTFAFVFFVYVGTLTTQSMLAARFGEPARVPHYEVRISTRILVGVLFLGLAFTAVAFQAMGDSMIERYANLILLRSIAPNIERTALTSNALALLQTWSWLTVVALFGIREQRGRTALWYVCLAMLILFAILGVSRRALFLPMVFAYLIFVMSDGRWRTGKLMAVAVAVLPLVAFGKEILAVISYGGTPENVDQTYSTLVAAGLRASSDIGITVTESLGTISMIDIPPRYGIDHLMSVLQRFPEGMLGLDFEFPERIVRLSTETFADEWAVDIPPGLMGQMWLDFRVFGPLIWGMAFGLQLGVLQYAWSRTRRSLQSAAVFFILVFVIGLPVNSGSFDFTFSIDIIMLMVVLFGCVSMRRQSASTLFPDGSVQVHAE